MQFAKVAGQYKIKNRLISFEKESRISHAILFWEESGFGALPLAVAFAAYIACPNKNDTDSCGSCPSCNKFAKLIHPDLHFAMPVNSTKEITSEKKPVSDLFAAKWREIITQDPYFTEQDWYRHIGVENKSGIIGVNEAALISKKMSLRSFEGGAKFMVIWLPERMNQEAANKLLKLIEEPPPETYIFMVSESPERVIPTILSRCQIFRVPPIEPEDMIQELIAEFDTDNNQAAFWAKISGGSITKARMMIADSERKLVFDQSLTSLLEGCVSKDLMKVISFWEEIASGGREYQKEFCEYLLEFLRRSLMVSCGAEDVANVPHEYLKFIKEWSGRLKPTFYNKAYNAVNDAIQDINRNVNSKYIFADLSNRFFLSL